MNSKNLGKFLTDKIFRDVVIRFLIIFLNSSRFFIFRAFYYNLILAYVFVVNRPRVYCGITRSKNLDRIKKTSFEPENCAIQQNRLFVIFSSSFFQTCTCNMCIKGKKEAKNQSAKRDLTVPFNWWRYSQFLSSSSRRYNARGIE